ncbi:hypothetical protein [Streptomyces sp. R02]|uniref:Uncharacterized protein n=1 Tax=Streptomyces sp. R02 TaxID=3238623 RepID=A0AB39LWC9_9ACTN
MLENLGKYGEITKQAAEAGGVDQFISAIEKAAYTKGAARGAVIAAAAAATAVGGVAAAVKTYRARKARAEEAKEQLRATVRESEEDDA